MRYRFWLICINYNFDFLVLYKMYFQNYFARRSIILESFTSHLQHSRPCCIRYTNSRLRLEFVYLIQHGRSCCKYYMLPHTYTLLYCSRLKDKDEQRDKDNLCWTSRKSHPIYIKSVYFSFPLVYIVTLHKR